MILKRIHRLIPFWRLFRILLILSVLLQLAVISYNHFSGYYHVTDLADFLNRLVYSTVLSLIGSYLIAYPDLYVILILNKYLPWKERAMGRIFFQFFSILIIAGLVAVFITFFAHSLDRYEEPFSQVLLANILIMAVVNLLLMVVLEAWVFFSEGKSVEERAQELEKELSSIRFEVLKSQINPHFMFNSLNVLSALISRDPAKAQDFVDEFSMIYRYVLETIEKPLVKVRKEIEFIRSYMFLQQIRYGGNLQFSIDLPSEITDAYIPPLSLQTVVENAIKHNAISASQPLRITLESGKDELVIRNNIQSKVSGSRSTGIGQKNLEKRYAILGNYVPLFKVRTDFYEVRLPIIKELKDEGTDHRG